MGMVTLPEPVPHRDIIAREGGSAAVARRITEHEEAIGRKSVDANQVQAWKRGNSIPGPYFEAFAAQGLATLEELAAGAAARRVPA